MRTYENKDELKNERNKSFAKYISEFDIIPESLYEIIDSLSDEELFEPHMRKWADEATKTAVWEVCKFIHVNTVALFGTFRTKIRKWKKMAL